MTLNHREAAPCDTKPQGSHPMCYLTTELPPYVTPNHREPAPCDTKPQRSMSSTTLPQAAYSQTYISVEYFTSPDQNKGPIIRSLFAAGTQGSKMLRF